MVLDIKFGKVATQILNKIACPHVFKFLDPICLASSMLIKLWRLKANSILSVKGSVGGRWVTNSWAKRTIERENKALTIMEMMLHMSVMK